MSVKNDEITEIEVTGDSNYTVTIGRGVISQTAEQLGDGPTKVLIMYTPSVGKVADNLREELSEKYAQVLMAEIPDAEGAKRIEVCNFAWEILGQADFSRNDAVVGIGGGAATDFAGFIAGTWMRGIKVVHVPTTVIGMVDAAVGGKTAINTNQGKNMIGVFHSPAAVLCDLDLLDTLPKNEILAGFAEVAKCGFIAEPEILDILEADVEKATDPATSEFKRLVELSIRVKAEIVSEDYRESGKREFLNYGHTLGHAIEHAERYQWRHGVAIAIGMMYAAELAHMVGSLSTEAVERHRRILSSLTLPLQYPAGRWEGLLATMQRDKKARRGMLRFIILDEIGKPRILSGVDDAMLQFAYQEIAD